MLFESQCSLVGFVRARIFWTYPLQQLLPFTVVELLMYSFLHRGNIQLEFACSVFQPIQSGTALSLADL